MASDVDTAMNFDRRLFERTREDADFLCVYLGKGSVESERQIDYRKQERMEVGDELTDLPEKICDMYAKIDHAPVYADLKMQMQLELSEKKRHCMQCSKILRLISQSDIITVMSDFFCWWMMKSNMSGSVCFRILEMRREHVISYAIMRAKIIF